MRAIFKGGRMDGEMIDGLKALPLTIVVPLDPKEKFDFAARGADPTQPRDPSDTKDLFYRNTTVESEDNDGTRFGVYELQVID